MSDQNPPVTKSDERRYDDADEGLAPPKNVRVAGRRALAQQRLQQLAAVKGEPAAIAMVRGRHLVQSFWAQAWCRNLDRYQDYVLRLARGRSYVRNGCLLDLQIAAGEIEAQVSGAELHRVTIQIATLPSAAWQRLVTACVGRVGTLVELFNGTLAAQTLTVLVDAEYGLFPNPSEMRFSCNCLDVARLCEHAAAALYGVAVRLETAPELFFTLRGVDQNELVRCSRAQLQGISAKEAAVLDHREMEELFGISILDDPS